MNKELKLGDKVKINDEPFVYEHDFGTIIKDYEHRPFHNYYKVRTLIPKEPSITVLVKKEDIEKIRMSDLEWKIRQMEDDKDE